MSTKTFSHPIEYDRMRRRLWICGQRCHHGATGALLATGVLVAAAVGRVGAQASVGLMAGGALLMAHDWKDRSIWFEPGHGNQP